MRRKRTGSRLLSARGLGLLAAILLWLAPAALPARPGKGKKLEASYALVAGTVFRETGMSLRGAEVQIEATGSSSTGKFKKQKALSDARGEFAFPVPPIEATYRISVKAPGYEPQQKDVSVGGYERLDVFFRLEPASK